MKKFTGYIPLCATAVIDIDAEDEDDAMRILMEKHANYEIDLGGFDAEHPDSWWIDEED